MNQHPEYITRNSYSRKMEKLIGGEVSLRERRSDNEIGVIPLGYRGFSENAHTRDPMKDALCFLRRRL